MGYAESGNSRIWWEAVGSGTPVVLINGLSSPSDVWFRLVPVLAAHHVVITLDNPGTGRTETAVDGFTMSDLADAAAAVIAAAGFSSAHVLGMSMGGLIAQELALDHPSTVRGLVLVSTHAGAPHMVNDQDSLDALVRASGLPPEERTRALAALAYSPTTPVEVIDEDLAIRARRPTSEQGYRAQLAATGAWERVEELHRLGRPTLVLHGEQDRLVSVDNARHLAEAIPQADVAILDAGHQLFSDQPEAGARAVLEFLATVDRQSRGAAG